MSFSAKAVYFLWRGLYRCSGVASWPMCKRHCAPLLTWWISLGWPLMQGSEEVTQEAARLSGGNVRSGLIFLVMN